MRDQLLQILADGDSLRTRVGAAHGLSAVAKSQPHARNALLEHVSTGPTNEQLSMACAWALEPLIGTDNAITEAFRLWLDVPGLPKLQQVAAQSLATAIAADRIPWDHQAVEKIEHVLMSLDEPCQHALTSLEELATAREVRSCLRVETVLRDSLQSIVEHIELAFIFGSTARNRQIIDSDIDLFILGEATLKDLSTGLRTAEKTLGRRINPVIYSRESFCQKYQAGDPFLLDVYRREKIPVIQSMDKSSKRDLDDELRAMVAERVAETV
ncbi:MAG: nucleotidyltransferase domain-containing protein [Planctomycetes bacterium]|nr:nucleotidyltransferase domain-containing protein [Planctomycetota bacterium]